MIHSESAAHPRGPIDRYSPESTTIPAWWRRRPGCGGWASHPRQLSIVERALAYPTAGVATGTVDRRIDSRDSRPTKVDDAMVDRAVVGRARLILARPGEPADPTAIFTDL